MNIYGKHYRTIWQNEDDDSVEVIDQRLLPFEFKTVRLHTVEEIHDAIASMMVRGAPLIGIAAAYGMYLAAKNLKADADIQSEMNKAALYLNSARPTAVNLAWATRTQLHFIKDSIDKNIVKDILRQSAARLADEDVENCRRMGTFGLDMIKKIADKKKGETVNILTHCNAGWLACIDWGTATSPIYHAFEAGIPIHVWVDETRPRCQGARLTAFELGQQGVPHTVIADNTGGHLMQHGQVDMVIVGSDRTTANGDVCNKIGTYLKALAANDNNIPFYAALPASTIDWSMEECVKSIPIEERNSDEVHFVEGWDGTKMNAVRITPENSNAANYGFDVTPARLVTGIITERGIAKASKEGLADLFPEFAKS